VGTPQDQRTTPTGEVVVGMDIFGYTVTPPPDTPRHEHGRFSGFATLPYRCATGHEWGQYTEVSCGCDWLNTAKREQS
jgi:hypothetical protein